jgi:hypothetical protein
MATIGPYTVLVFDGRLRPAVQKIAVLESAPGVDGVAVVRGGWTNPPQKVRTVTETTSASLAYGLLDKYRALHGQVVNITDQFGFSWPNVTVTGVTGVIGSAGYSSKWRVEMEWMLLPVTTRPSGA